MSFGTDPQRAGSGPAVSGLIKYIFINIPLYFYLSHSLTKEASCNVFTVVPPSPLSSHCQLQQAAVFRERLLRHREPDISFRDRKPV